MEQIRQYLSLLPKMFYTWASLHQSPFRKKPDSISQLAYCQDRATSSLHFRNMLAKQGMSVNFEKDNDRRIVGVTFIDHRLHVAFSSDKLSQLYNPISFNARINSGTWDEEDPFDFYDSKDEDESESENPHFAIGEWLIAEGRSKSLEKDPVYRKRKSLHF